MASPFEALLLAQTAFLNNPPRFRGAIRSATALTTASNINFTTVVEDNYSGWNSSSHYWVVPVAGLYEVHVSFKWNGSSPSSAPAINLLDTGTAVLISANASSTSTFAGVQMHGLVRCAVNDQLAVQLANAGFTTQVDAGDNNFYQIIYCSQ